MPAKASIDGSRGRVLDETFAAVFASATTAQKEEITRNFKRLEFDPKFMTLLSVRRLGIPESWIGRRVDIWLSSLTQTDATTHLATLKNLP